MVRVGDAIHLRRSQVKVDRGGQYGEIGVRSFGRGIFHKEPISGAKLGNKRVFWIEPGDLVLSNVFAWEGAIAVAGDGERGKIGSHRFMTYVADPEVAQVEYLCHYFLSDHGLPLIQNASPGGAGRNRTLGIDAFENLEEAYSGEEFLSGHRRVEMKDGPFTSRIGLPHSNLKETDRRRVSYHWLLPGSDN